MCWLGAGVLGANPPIIVKTLTLLLAVSLVLAHNVATTLDEFAAEVEVFFGGVMDCLWATILAH